MTPGLAVMRSPCNECLFSRRRLVSAERKAAIIKDCLATDTHFLCHKGTLFDQQIVCAAWAKRYTSQGIRIAGRLNMIVRVDGPAAREKELVLPCDPAKLAADVARFWPNAARLHGVDAKHQGIAVDNERELYMPARAPFVPVRRPPLSRLASSQAMEAWERAVEDLSRSLEDAGYAIERRGAGRIVQGWAATSDARLIDLEAASPWNPVAQAWRARLLAERQARDAATAAAPDAKLAHARGLR